MRRRNGGNSRNASSEIGTIATGRLAPAKQTYVGRFAPSPSGPLHIGSLAAAVASFLDAHQHHGRWLVRIEDIDPPRERRGAVDAILTGLDACGFAWDGPVTYQSQSRPHHDAALRQLQELGMVYACGCSRSDLADAEIGPLGKIYPGSCRAGTTATRTALRVKTNSQPVSFSDSLQGQQQRQLERESGDFVVRRRDGLIAYQLAVVVDDFLQGITHVVRGIDLLESTPRQLWLQQLLGFSHPDYAHIPVIVDRNGSKLSKSEGAAALDLAHPTRALHAVLALLGQHPPADLARAPLGELWAWAKSAWDGTRLAGRGSISIASNVEQMRNSPDQKNP